MLIRWYVCVCVCVRVCVCVCIMYLHCVLRCCVSRCVQQVQHFNYPCRYNTTTILAHLTIQIDELNLLIKYHNHIYTVYARYTHTYTNTYIQSYLWGLVCQEERGQEQRRRGGEEQRGVETREERGEEEERRREKRGERRRGRKEERRRREEEERSRGAVRSEEMMWKEYITAKAKDHRRMWEEQHENQSFLILKYIFYQHLNNWYMSWVCLITFFVIVIVIFITLSPE